MLATRTHLVLARPERWSPATSGGAGDAGDAGALDVRRRLRPTAAEYRALYAGVGRAWHWRDRDAWSDERLQRHLDDPAVSVWVLTEDGEAAGYFELVRSPADETTSTHEVRIALFGLLERFHGRGLGRRLLERALAEAWAGGADRVVLDTCTLDHPAALPNYLARGFTIVREETYEVDAPSTSYARPA